MTKSVQTCVYCGGPTEGNYSIHRNGFDEVPEVPLCDEDGSELTPTCDEIWAVIHDRRVQALKAP